MFALTRFAHAEFSKAFKWNYGTPIARDFLWLTMFFALCSFLLFFGISAYQGIWNRFEQVLLGALSDSGPPVRVNYHFVERPERITAQLVHEFDQHFPQLSIVPMRHFDGKSGTVVLPGLSVKSEMADAAETLPEAQRQIEIRIDRAMSWGLSREGNSTPLQIFALPVSAPIWNWVEHRPGAEGVDIHAPFPMIIAASRTLFSRHFRYENYRDAVMVNQAVPCVIRSSLPAQLKDPGELKTLVLEVKEGDLRTAFHEFKVIWVDSFPMPDEVAFIMPLSTVELLMATERRPKLEVNLESRGQPSERVQQIWLRDVAEDTSSAEKFRKMASCLGTVPVAAA
jgi:hypothetical protein